MTSIARTLLLLLLLVVSTTAQTREETPFDFYTRGPYRESVPRPQSILRYDVGDFHTNYAQMERVVERIAQAAPDRVRVTDIGETNEHRMMHVLTISAPENMRRLEEIKANVARLADPRLTTPAEAQTIADATPVVVWLNYTIHGNESASFETMMQVVYQLAASDEPATLDILRNCVVLINVCANPDGHERFVTWYNSVGVGSADPAAGEHREPWSVYGRVNRYRFDLNRDNLVSSQVETRNVQRAYLQWHPQVFVDHHGQTSQFFFPPAALPVNPNLPGEATARWLNVFGRANAAQFDQRQWDFYVRDVFDLFYPGYWDSWPSLQGAVGMTYETDGGGWKGLRWRRDDDTIVTLRSGIAKHFVASLTTLATASANRAARVREFYDFRRSAVEEGRQDSFRRVVIPYGTDPARETELVEILLRAGIEVKISRGAFKSERAHAYGQPDAVAARAFSTPAFVIDMDQPAKRLAKAMLEPNTEQDAAFKREQLERFARNERRGADKEDYGFYDVTAWSLPLAFGVEAYWTEDAQPFTGSAELLRLSEAATGGDPSIKLVLPDDVTRAGVPEGRAAVAYVIPYAGNGAATLVARLLREDYKLAVATRALNAGGRNYPRGTVIARVSRNAETLHQRITTLARENNVTIYSVNTAFPDTGDVGVGSETVVSLKRPRIIVIADEPVSHVSYGAMWWLFDRTGVEFTPMTISALKRADLDRYNVIILPDGSPGAYFSAFGKPGVDLLRGWCERGGTLVAVKGGAAFAALKDVNLTSSRLVGGSDDDGEKPAPAPPKETDAEAAETPASGAGRRKSGEQLSVAEQRRAAAAQTEKADDAPPPLLPPLVSPSARPGEVPEAVPGAIMLATVDRTSPLTYGYDASVTLPVLVESAYFFRLSKDGNNAVVFAAEESAPLRLAGFIWPNNTEKLLRGTAHLIGEQVGRGHVVLYAEDPNYRAIWRSTTRLFFNSFLFQPIF